MYNHITYIANKCVIRRSKASNIELLYGFIRICIANLPTWATARNIVNTCSPLRLKQCKEHVAY